MGKIVIKFITEMICITNILLQKDRRHQITFSPKALSCTQHKKNTIHHADIILIQASYIIVFIQSKIFLWLFMHYC